MLQFIDDFLCVSQDFDQHMDHLRLFFKKCQEGKITLNFFKIHLIREEVKFLGFRLNKNGLSTDPEKIDKIQNFPKPKNQKQLRGFLGLVNFYARFTDQLSKEFQPLLELLHKSI